MYGGVGEATGAIPLPRPGRETDDSKPRITLRFIRATTCVNKRVSKHPARTFGTINTMA